MRHARQKMQHQILVGALAIAVIIVLQSPSLVFSGITNQTMTAYTRSLSQDSSVRAVDSQYEQLQHHQLELISDLWPNRWLGAPTSFLRESQIIHASEQEEYGQAIALIEQTPSMLRQIPKVRDAAALAYLAAAEASIAPSAEIEKALSLRPNDLYANFRLWEDAQARNAPEIAAVYAERLRYFTLDSLAPTNDRLMTKTLEVIPDLLGNELWTQEEVDGVAAFLVWQHFDKEPVIDFLRGLAAAQPDNASWPFYLGEFYQRRDEISLAQSSYQAALTLNSADANTIQRLASLNEDAQTTEPDAPPFDTSSAAGQDVTGYVAEQLGIPSEQVMLGENLVMNGRFMGDGNSVHDWELRTYLGPDGNQGLYVAGVDNLYPDTTARILALRGGPLTNTTTTYAEYWGVPLSMTSGPLVTIVEYASDYPIGSTGLIYLGEYGIRDGATLLNEGLPDTDRSWERIILVSRSPRDLRSLMPLLRSWGAGQLWVRSLEIRPVSVANEAS